MSTTQVTGNDLSNAWVGWLVGIVFGAFGVGLLGYDLKQIAAGIEAASWVEAEATLDLVEVGSRAEGGTRVTALAYHYDYEGKRYDSHRGTLFSAFGSRFHRGGYLLRGKIERGETVPCYVDPDTPRHALLNRRLSAGSCAIMTAFSSAFVVMGVGVLLAMTLVAPSESEVLKASRRYPDEPWNWIPAWREQKIREESSNGSVAIFLLSLVGLMGFGAGAVVACFVEPRDAVAIPYGAGLIVSGVAGVFAGTRWLHTVGEDRSVLEPESHPIRRGDSLQGQIRITKNAFAEGDTLAVTFQCCQATATLSGYGIAKRFWKTEQAVEPVWRRGHAEFSVEIAIPEDTPEFDRTDGIDTLWWLEVRRQGELHGRCVRFIVPVF